MLGRLLGIAEAMDADMLANPKKYYDRAVTEIIRLRTVLEEANEALRVPLHDVWSPPPDVPPPFEPMQVVSVMKDEWERLKRVERIVLAARR